MGITIRFFCDLVLVGTVEVKQNEDPIISEHLPALIGKDAIQSVLKNAQAGMKTGSGTGFTWDTERS